MKGNQIRLSPNFLAIPTCFTTIYCAQTFPNAITPECKVHPFSKTDTPLEPIKQF